MGMPESTIGAEASSVEDRATTDTGTPVIGSSRRIPGWARLRQGIGLLKFRQAAELIT